MTLAPRSAQLPDSPHRDSLDPAPTPSSQDQRLLKALATAMVNHPRATMGELAELAGVSRATLNRHCGTREGLKRAWKAMPGVPSNASPTAPPYSGWSRGKRYAS